MVTHMTSSLIDLPTDVLRLVVASVAEKAAHASTEKPKQAAKLLARLSATCRTLNVVIDKDEDATAWQAAWLAYTRVHTDLASVTRPACPKARLKLYTQRGCQFCAAPRIRKVYREFEVRCCQPCLYARTISGYRLKTDYLVTQDRFAGLPHLTVSMWDRHMGDYTLDFYWIESVERRLGMSLVAFAERERARRAAAAETQRAQRERELQMERARAEDRRKKEFDAALAEALREAPFDQTYVMAHTTGVQQRNRDAQWLVQRAREHWNKTNFQKGLDEAIKRETRARGITMRDVRRTATYKARVKQGASSLSDADWADVRGDLFDLGIQSWINDDPLIHSVTQVRSHPLYQQLKSEGRVPDQAEWDTIKAPAMAAIKEAQELALRRREQELEQMRLQRAQYERVNHMKVAVEAAVAALPQPTTCPYCPSGTARLFMRQGLVSHTCDVHVRRDWWPSGVKPAVATAAS